MKIRGLLFLAALVGTCSLVTFTAPAAFAEEVAKPASTRAKMLFGQPVNVNIAGGGTLPQGKMLTILNTSFADKNRHKRGYKGSDVFSQAWLFKFRYGITNHLELSITTPYINNKRSSPTMSPAHVEGFGDQNIQLLIAPWNEHQGDPISVSLGLGVMIPTGAYGKNHLPGNGVWGTRMVLGAGKFVTKDIKLDTEVVWSTPFARGNQQVMRGDSYQWNTNARYLFDNFDIGFESTLTHQESGTKRVGGSNRNMRNGITEWMVGPSVNIPIDSLGMWAGVGVFLPALQDVKGPSTVEDARYEFKIGKMW